MDRLREPGVIALAGERIDLGRIETPAYVVGTREDHIAPWRGVWRSAQLLSGSSRFVLGESGHIAGIVNPPSRGKYGYHVASRGRGRIPTRGSHRPTRIRAPGGRTGSAGSAAAPVAGSRLGPPAAGASARSRTHPAATSVVASTGADAPHTGFARTTAARSETRFSFSLLSALAAAARCPCVRSPADRDTLR
jgi:hypothetical protein